MYPHVGGTVTQRARTCNTLLPGKEAGLILLGDELGICPTCDVGTAGLIHKIQIVKGHVMVSFAVSQC